jgi:hypothetical protein
LKDLTNSIGRASRKTHLQITISFERSNPIQALPNLISLRLWLAQNGTSSALPSRKNPACALSTSTLDLEANSSHEPVWMFTRQPIMLLNFQHAKFTLLEQRQEGYTRLTNDNNDPKCFKLRSSPRLPDYSEVPTASSKTIPTS